MKNEFLNINGNIKEKLVRVTGNVEILENYLKNEENKKKLSSSEIKHLENRIEMMKMFHELGAKNLKEIDERKPVIAPVEREDGTIELLHIHQDKVQNTFNGCWSVSLQLLLQSRGINLTQEQIRAFRSDILTEEEANELNEEETVNNDKKATLDKKTDLVMKLLPNTSVNMSQVSYGLGGGTIEDAVKQFKNVVTQALKDDCSPVSMVTRGHFRTIVGIKGDEVLLKDSIQFRTHGANHTYKIKIEDIIKNASSAVGLYWLHDMHLEKDGSCAEFKGNSALAYKEGKIDFKPLSKEPPSGKKYRNRPLTAVAMESEKWVKDAEMIKVETLKYDSASGGFGTYAMNLPKQIHHAQPRKIRRYTEAEIGLFDKLKEREVLEDLQMRLNTVDETGYYPAMTEENLQELKAAYEKVSNMYDEILNDESFKLTESQKKHLQELKGRSEVEKQIISNIEVDKEGVLPTYREALRNGKLAMMQENEKTRYEEKEKALLALKEKFAQLHKDGHKNSKEYTEMITATERVYRIMEAVINPEKWKELGVDPVPNEYETQDLLKKYEKAATVAVDKYIKEKGNPYTEFGKNRLATAKELKEEMVNSITAFLEEKRSLIQEGNRDEIMKENARLKAELSKIKPPFSSDDLKALRDKFEVSTPMREAADKALLALDQLGSMKYLKDNNKAEPDKKRVQEHLAKVVAFTILAERDLLDPKMDNKFNEKYFNIIVEGIKNTNVLDGRSVEEWFDILEKKEGAPSLHQVCAEMNEAKFTLHNDIEKLVQRDKKVETYVKNQYMIYSPTKINFDERNGAGISDYVKKMNSVKDAKYDIKAPEGLGLNNKELALLTSLQLATLEVGQHYNDPNSNDPKYKMLNGVSFMVENTAIERENDENKLGAVIDKEREALSKVLKELAVGNEEPMCKFMEEALDNFRVALHPEDGFTVYARLELKVGADIYDMLQKHPNFVPKTMNKEHLQAYKGLKECSKVLEEVSQARKDLTEVNYYNLKDASERAKLEDALAKITLESVMNKALVDDYKAQNEVIDEKKAQASVGITMEIQEIQERLKGKENDVERTKQVSVCARKLNDVNSMKLELIRPAKMITDMNSNIKKELLERIKNTEAFKSGIESLCNKQSVRENFLLNNEKLLGQFTSRVVEKHMDIVKDLSAPEKNVVAEAAQASVEKS